MSKSSQPTFADVQAAFESRRVLHCSRAELEQLLIAAAAHSPADPAGQARAREMGAAMRELLAARSQPRQPKLATVAVILAIAALVCSGLQAYYSRVALSTASDSAAEVGDYIRAANRDDALEDPRIQVSVEELARRAPTLRTGTLQAWWAGEQARRVQRLESLAKRQVLAGDRDGAVRSVQRADAIRSNIEPLAQFEKPPQQ